MSHHHRGGPGHEPGAEPPAPWGADYVGAEYPQHDVLPIEVERQTPWALPIRHVGLRVPKKRLLAEVPPGYFRRHWRTGAPLQREGFLFLDGSLSGHRIVGRYMFEERRVAFASFIVPFDEYPTRQELDRTWKGTEAALRVHLAAYGSPAISQPWRTVWSTAFTIIEIKAHIGRQGAPLKISLFPR